MHPISRIQSVLYGSAYHGLQEFQIDQLEKVIDEIAELQQKCNKLELLLLKQGVKISSKET